MNLICGINPILEALSAGTRHFDRLLVVKGLRSRRVSEAIARASHLAVPLRFETRETLDRMAPGVPHQGLIAVVSAKPSVDLPTLLQAVRDPALLVVLDGVEDPRNLGAILRTAEAAGADGVLLPERHSAGLSETVNRASAGALEHVRVARIGNLVQALSTLKERGIWVVGFDAAGTERWDAVDFRRPIALVLGGEGKGIRRLVREHCDHLVGLPLFGHVSSLNVSVAAGIALYEVIRQRGSVPSHVRPIPIRPPSALAQIVGPGPEDAEQDPGALGYGLKPGGADRDGEGEGDELTDEDRGGVVELHEEAAWAGPTILKPVGFRRGRQEGRRPDRSVRTGAGGPPPPGGRRGGEWPPPPPASPPAVTVGAGRDPGLPATAKDPGIPLASAGRVW
ncbi:MAG TPA: 23S rRNA (guanosine(2251)-2'-O)-methyltransferase RlmB [Vicinamibacteria bacterium]|nr:23S rRNA (guanosine(2251)-2'-O)-methyltransferase RlmB [Vicinamibacteria bacterium]